MIIKRIKILVLISVVLLISCTTKDVSIEGTIFDDRNKSGSYEATDYPLGDVLIKSGNMSTTSDTSTGKFILEGEIVGADSTIKLFLSKNGYRDTVASVLIPDSKENNTLSPQYPVVVVMQSN